MGHEGDAFYQRAGINFLEDKGYFGKGLSYAGRALRPPVTPIFLGILSKLFGEHQHWARRLVIVLLSSAFCIMVLLTVQKLFGLGVAFWTGLGCAVHPMFVFYGSQLIPDTVFLLLAWCGIWILITAETQSRYFVAGLIFGLSALARAVFWGFIPLATVWTWWHNRSFQKAFLFLLAAILIGTPWWVRNRIVLGEWLLGSTMGAYVFWIAHNPLSDGGGGITPLPEEAQALVHDEMALDHWFWKNGIEFVRNHPGLTLKQMGMKFINFWRVTPHRKARQATPFVRTVSAITYISLFALALWGAWSARSLWRKKTFFYLLIIYYTTIHIVFHAVMRHRLPLEPILIMLAVLGLKKWLSRLLWG